MSLHHVHLLIGGARHKREILKPHYRKKRITLGLIHIVILLLVLHTQGAKERGGHEVGRLDGSIHQSINLSVYHAIHTRPTCSSSGNGTYIDTDQGMNVIKQYGWTEWIETNKALTWDLYCKFSAPV